MAMTSNQLWSRLLDHGFLPIRRTAGTALFDRDGERVLVPDEPGELPDWIARSIEWHLTPRLGPGWLHDDHDGHLGRADELDELDTTATDGAPRVVLRLVLRAEPDGERWQAYVADEPRIAVCGETAWDAEDRARRAAALWYDTRPELVSLVVLEPLSAAGTVDARHLHPAGRAGPRIRPTPTPSRPGAAAGPTSARLRVLEPVDG